METSNENDLISLKLIKKGSFLLALLNEALTKELFSETLRFLLAGL